MATVRRELGGEVAELRSGLTELRGEVSAEEDDLRSVLEDLDALGGRVGRIESMVRVLWRSPANARHACTRHAAKPGPIRPRPVKGGDDR